MGKVFMSEAKSIENHIDEQPQKKKNKILGRFLSFVRETLAILIWVYAITKIFIFDIDIFLIDRIFPNYTWVINYKFLFLIGILSIIWLMTKNRNIILWSLFIIFYPVIFVFWKIPFFLFRKRSWNFVFALIDSIISFFKSLKISFITTSFFLISTFVILGTSNNILLWLSIAILTVILLLVYIQRIVLVVKRSEIYQIYSSFFNFYGKYVRENPVVKDDENIINSAIESMDDDQIDKWISNVQQLVLANRFCVFVAKKLKDYQSSGFTIVSSIFSLLLLVLYTVFTFAIINFGLFKIDQSFYTFSYPPSFFNFFY